MIEILAVVSIVGLLFILVIPKITNSLKNKKKDVDITTNNIIITAAKNYVHDNVSKFEKIDNNIYCLPLTTLIKKDYLDSPVKNVTDNKDITNIKSIKIIYDKTFKYELVDKQECSVAIAEKEKTEYIDSDGKKYLKTSYIESTGTQYIDTGFTAKKNVSHKFVIDFQLSNLIGTQQTIMGHDLNDIKINSNGYMQGNTSYPYIGLDRRVVTVEYIPTNNGNNHFITMDTDDNQHAERNSTYWPSTANVTLFTNSKNISERMSSGRIYSAKIYNNDILVRDFVPVIDEKYIACMFDKVEKKCYYNQGSGCFFFDVTPFEKTSLLSLIMSKKNDSTIDNYSSGNTHEMYSFSQPETVQTPALTDYRYIGNNPYNYAYIDKELWRIIGVFSVEDENGNWEERIKLIKDSKITTMPWDADLDAEWVSSDVKLYLENTYLDNNLIQSLSVPVKYYLGSIYNDVSKNVYETERSTDVYGERDYYWIGKFGLIYPSDYIYTYALGVNSTCFNKIVDCNSTNSQSGWIFNSKYQWTITSRASNNQDVYILNGVGDIGSGKSSRSNIIRPVMYLSTDVKTAAGNGSLESPYHLST